MGYETLIENVKWFNQVELSISYRAIIIITELTYNDYSLINLQLNYDSSNEIKTIHLSYLYTVF